jgi:hypothetical protein
LAEFVGFLQLVATSDIFDSALYCSLEAKWLFLKKKPLRWIFQSSKSKPKMPSDRRREGLLTQGSMAAMLRGSLSTPSFERRLLIPVLARDAG